MSLVSMISDLATRIAAEVKLRGIPAGGTAGQVVTKTGTVDYSTAWANILFADPTYDRIVFWDDSAKAFTPLIVSYGLVLTATLLQARDTSTTQTGIVELATSGETVAGTDTFRAVTPAGLASAFLNNVASEADPGTVELATTTEASTGTDTSRATTAAGVKAAIDARTATETAAGIVELATVAEAVAGTDTVRAVTPAGVKAVLDKAWTAYTPVLTAATTNPNLGTTPIRNAAYLIQGKLLFWRAILQSEGTGVSAGSGAYALAPPIAPTGSFAILGMGWMYGPAGFKPCIADSTNGRLIQMGGAYVDQTVGFASAGCVLSMSGAYQIA